MTNPNSKEGRIRRLEAEAEALLGLDGGALVARVRDRANGFEAEALALAYHRCWTAGRAAEAEAILERLFGGIDRAFSGRQPEFMGFLVPRCVRSAETLSALQGAEDLFQATLIGIYQKLRTPAGAIAHTAWTAFCWDRLTDAVRQRSRREIQAEDIDAEDPDTGQRTEHVELGRRQIWHGTVEPDRLPEVMQVLEEAAVGIEDAELRAVALDMARGLESPIDVRDPERPDVKPLTEQLGISRFAVRRRKAQASKILGAAYRAWADGDALPDRFE